MTHQPDHQPPLTEATCAVDGAEHGITKKGLSAGPTVSETLTRASAED